MLENPAYDRVWFLTHQSSLLLIWWCFSHNWVILWPVKEFALNQCCTLLKGMSAQWLAGGKHMVCELWVDCEGEFRYFWQPRSFLTTCWQRTVSPHFMSVIPKSDDFNLHTLNGLTLGCSLFSEWDQDESAKKVWFSEDKYTVKYAV